MEVMFRALPGGVPTLFWSTSMSALAKRFIVFGFTCFSCTCLTGLAGSDPQPRDLPGLHNFYQVNEHIYRGAQPANNGFSELAKLGIKTIIDLREPGSRSESEKKAVEAAGMHYLSFPLAGYGAPPNDVVSKLLTLLDDSTAGPVFVHCRRGADRTGTILAVYRIVHDHWENAKALAEAKVFGMSWTERAMQSYILGFKAPRDTSIAAAAGAQNQ
jgi:tyrosine-protein phosphatase SIW14